MNAIKVEGANSKWPVVNHPIQTSQWSLPNVLTNPKVILVKASLFYHEKNEQSIIRNQYKKCVKNSQTINISRRNK